MISTINSSYSHFNIKFSHFIVIIFAVLLSVIIGIESNYSLSSLSVLALCLLITPAFVMASINSKSLPIYIFSVWVLAPEIRRIIDLANGLYDPVSPVMVSPIFCTLMLIIPILRNLADLELKFKKPLLWFIITFIYAFIIGLVHNHLAAIWEMLNYVVPLLFLPYVLITRPSLKVRDGWMASFSTIAVMVAIYGWVQYLTAPPWDTFWMINSGMNSIGQPFPEKIRVFSTLNSPGPAGAFFAFALVVMLLQKKWRGPFGYIGILIVASALAITLVRSAWLMAFVGLVIYFFNVRKANRQKALIWFVISFAMFYLLLPYLPGSDTIAARGDTFYNLNEDQSANARLQFSTSFLSNILQNPLGTGFGSTGLATKLSNDGQLGEYGNFDNGILNIFYTFGFFFALVFFWAEWLLLKVLRSQRSHNEKIETYRALSISMLIAVNLSLLSYNNFIGLTGMLLWFIVSIGYMRNEESLKM